MILVALIAILLAGGLIAWIAGPRAPALARGVSIAALGVDLVLALPLGARRASGAWLAEASAPWIPRFGISIHLAMDGLSYLLVLLTLVIGILAVLTSWREIRERVGFFHMNLLWVLAGVLGVFLSMDLFLFYFFWELMLVPMYFLIGIWGHERRVYAAIKFFVFTQASGLLMLLAILGVAFAHRAATGTLTFDYADLLGTRIAGPAAFWLMLGFFIAFAVKVPAFPVHTWLPDAHTEAPTAGSVVLAGLLLKTGAYGLLRFAVPLFPDASRDFAPVAMLLGVIGIVYGAILAFAQTDLKRLVAYTSVSHMGFVLLGTYAWNDVALRGVVVQMLAHGLSTGGLFVLVGFLQERLHTRDISRMGGLWAVMPRMGTLALMLAMASLGLPGLGNFVAEFLVLLGAFRASPALTAVAVVGLVFATVYSLRIVGRVFHGGNDAGWKAPDLGAREVAVLAVMVLLLVWMGLAPNAILETAGPGLDALRESARAALGAGGAP